MPQLPLSIYLYRHPPLYDNIIEKLLSVHIVSRLLEGMQATWLTLSVLEDWYSSSTDLLFLVQSSESFCMWWI